MWRRAMRQGGGLLRADVTEVHAIVSSSIRSRSSQAPRSHAEPAQSVNRGMHVRNNGLQTPQYIADTSGSMLHW